MQCCGHFQFDSDAGDCCGSFSTSPGAFPFFGPLFLIPSANIVAGWDAKDLLASPVALWPDASGNGFDLTQAVGASQPTWGAATGPNGQPAVLFDGVDDYMINAVLDRPVPGTQPTFYWIILRQVTFTATDRLCGWLPGNARMVLAQVNASPELRQANIAFENSNNGLTINVFKRIETLFNNAITDYIKAGSVSSTGANAGNLDPGPGFQLGSNGFAVPTQFSNIEVCEFWIFSVLPSAAQLAALDAYASARYGPGVLT